MRTVDLPFDSERLVAICKRYGVARMQVFGSAACDVASPDDADDLDDDRAHASLGGLANEITSWDPYPADSLNGAVSPTHDRAGNLTDDGDQYEYSYDAWNRLVKVETRGTPSAVVGTYGYDALDRRISKGGASAGNADHHYYDEAWRRLEVRPSDSTTGGSIFVYGLRYIDDVVMRDRDADETGVLEERRYYLNDANFNVVMLVNELGEGIERIFYRAYGEPECHPFGDYDGDFDVDAADRTAAQSGPYNLLGDINLDGTIDTTDSNLGSNYLGFIGGYGVLSAASGSDDNSNDIGCSGFLWNDERGQYHVRYREYDPKLGRWLQRDPIKYADSMNNYLYLLSSPLARFDPFGLSSEADRWRDLGMEETIREYLRWWLDFLGAKETGGGGEVRSQMHASSDSCASSVLSVGLKASTGPLAPTRRKMTPCSPGTPTTRTQSVSRIETRSTKEARSVKATFQGLMSIISYQRWSRIREAVRRLLQLPSTIRLEDFRRADIRTIISRPKIASSGAYRGSS